MPKPDKREGLCLTCINMPSCMYCQNGTQPVLECNEFSTDAEASEVRSSKTKNYPATSDTAAPRNSIEEPEYIGICATCTQREKCSLSHTPGGVWHCEEYA